MISDSRRQWLLWQFNPSRIWRPLFFEFFSCLIFFSVIYVVSLNFQTRFTNFYQVGNTFLAEALSTGFMYIILVINMGPLCGAALNPVVSLALMIIGEHSIIKTIFYIVVQLGAATIAAALIPLLFTQYSTTFDAYPYDISAKLTLKTLATTANSTSPIYPTIIVTSLLLELLFSFTFAFFLMCTLFEPDSLIYIPQKSTTSTNRNIVDLLEKRKASFGGSRIDPETNASIGIHSPTPEGIIIPGPEFIVDPAHHLHLQLSPYWYRLENSMFNGTYFTRQFIAATTTGFLLMILIFAGVVFNPARIFGPSLINDTWQGIWIYWVGPAAGSLLGVFSYKYIYLPERTRGIHLETQLADRRFRAAI